MAEILCSERSQEPLRITEFVNESNAMPLWNEFRCKENVFSPFHRPRRPL